MQKFTTLLGSLLAIAFLVGLATTKFDAIKIGWINKSESAKRLLSFVLNDLILDYLFFIKEGFINHHKNCNTH